MDALTARALEHAAKMNDPNLTVEHMVLALAENPRCVWYGRVLMMRLMYAS